MRFDSSLTSICRVLSVLTLAAATGCSSAPRDPRATAAGADVGAQANPVSVAFVGASPADEATVSGLVTYEVEASTSAYGAQIAQVNFDFSFVATRPPFRFTLDTTQLPPGGNGYGITAQAVDTAGNVSTLLGRAINVANPAPAAGTPPTVYLESPAPDAPVAGTVALLAGAIPSQAPVVSVSYYASGGFALPGVGGVLPAVLVGTSNQYPFGIEWDSTAGVNGFYTLTAVATDAGGLTARTAPSNFYVENPVPNPSPPVVVMPSVAIASPAEGALLNGSFDVTLALSEPLPGATITGGYVYLDSYQIAAMGGPPPYTITLDPSQWTRGAHVLGASVFDSAGAVGESALVDITVGSCGR